MVLSDISQITSYTTRLSTYNIGNVTEITLSSQGNLTIIATLIQGCPSTLIGHLNIENHNWMWEELIFDHIVVNWHGNSFRNDSFRLGRTVPGVDIGARQNTGRDCVNVSARKTDTAVNLSWEVDIDHGKCNRSTIPFSAGNTRKRRLFQRIAHWNAFWRTFKPIGTARRACLFFS